MWYVSSRLYIYFQGEFLYLGFVAYARGHWICTLKTQVSCKWSGKIICMLEPSQHNRLEKKSFDLCLVWPRGTFEMDGQLQDLLHDHAATTTTTTVWRPPSQPLVGVYFRHALQCSGMTGVAFENLLVPDGGWQDGPILEVTLRFLEEPLYFLRGESGRRGT